MQLRARPKFKGASTVALSHRIRNRSQYPVTLETMDAIMAWKIGLLHNLSVNVDTEHCLLWYRLVLRSTSKFNTFFRSYLRRADDDDELATFTSSDSSSSDSEL